VAYRCSNCRRTHPAFHLACPDCGSWNSLFSAADRIAAEDPLPVALPDVKDIVLPRTQTGIDPLDRLLGGGFVPGCSVLLIGTPGAGKSTLVLQLLRNIDAPSLYVTGEESVQQLKLRANRLAINSQKVFLLFETNVRKITGHIERLHPALLVIDSIQAMYTDLSGAAAGSTPQVRKCIYTLRRTAHQKGLILLVVGQVTKERGAAGPKLLEHAVDVVLYLEENEGGGNGRILRSSKNRFGSTLNRCLLSMTESGLLFSTPAGPRGAEKA
jgi:DNA repair protein RadA/Sms